MNNISLDNIGQMCDNISILNDKREKYMINYENVAEVGNKIKAYDFESINGDRDDYYLVGIVTNKTDYCYEVEVIESPMHEERVGIEMHVPFGGVFDWEGRVSLVA